MRIKAIEKEVEEEANAAKEEELGLEYEMWKKKENMTLWD
jgi:hypothetical protein